MSLLSAISVIVPVYNGEAFIVDNIKKLHKFLVENFSEFEIIVVNDGSTDKTYEMVLSLKLPELKIVSYDNNRGKGFALRRGFFNSLYNNVIFIDADLPYSFDTILNLTRELENSEYGMVICSRALSESVCVVRYVDLMKLFFRWFAGRIINIFIRLILGIPFKDTQAGLKGFNKQKLNNIFSMCFLNSWGFDCEIIFLSYKYNIKIKEIPVYQEVGFHGSTLRFFDGIIYFIDVLKIFIRHKLGRRFKFIKK